MKKFLFAILVVLPLLAKDGSLAKTISWYGDFNTAYQEALKQNKMLLVLLIQKNCPACKESIETSFINQSYIDTINKEFIAVLVTKGQKSSYPIEMLYTLTYPSLFLLDKNELFICEPLRDKITPDRVKSYLKECLKLGNKR
jgi:thioredoxin-related protein